MQLLLFIYCLISDMDLSYGLRRLLRHRGKTCNLHEENPVIGGGKTL
jgi:hypothetical protein